MRLYLSGTIGDRFCVWPLDAEMTGVGRSSKNAIQIVDATVSKDHAEILRAGDRYTLRDLASRNGTRVNGVVVEAPVILRAGDRLEIGHVPLRVTTEDPQPATQLSDSAGISSNLKLRADQILERTSSMGEDAARFVQVLAEAGRLLILPRPLRETCEEILRLVEQAVPASRLILLLQQDPAAEPVQIAARYRGGSAKEPLVLSRAIMKTVMQECSSVLIKDASADPRYQMQHSIVSQAVHSAMAVPLFDNEKVLGLIYADTNVLTTSYEQAQLEVLTIIANMAAVKITNARLLEAEQARLRMAQELATAAGIQRSLLPAGPPIVEGYQFQAFIETCYEVGGDLYDFYQRPDGTLYFMLGDVSGKGMGAALLMSSVLATSRVLYDHSADAGEFTSKLNAIVHRGSDSKHFVTAFIGVLEPATGKLSYVNAGHPHPYLVSATGELRELESNGVPIGILPSFPFTAASIVLEPGETLAVFSDGITEAQRGEEFFGEQRIADAIREGCDGSSLEELSRKTIALVAAFVAGEARADDMTLVLARRGALLPGAPTG